MTDPKPPEDILLRTAEKVYTLLGAHTDGCRDSDAEYVAAYAPIARAISHLAAVATLVGRIQQHQGECIHPTPCALVDRLLAELEKCG